MGAGQRALGVQSAGGVGPTGEPSLPKEDDRGRTLWNAIFNRLHMTGRYTKMAEEVGEPRKKATLSPQEESVRKESPQNRVKCSNAGWTQKDRAPSSTRSIFFEGGQEAACKTL